MLLTLESAELRSTAPCWVGAATSLYRHHTLCCLQNHHRTKCCLAGGAPTPSPHVVAAAVVACDTAVAAAASARAAFVVEFGVAERQEVARQVATFGLARTWDQQPT